MVVKHLERCRQRPSGGNTDLTGDALPSLDLDIGRTVNALGVNAERVFKLRLDFLLSACVVHCRPLADQR